MTYLVMFQEGVSPQHRQAVLSGIHVLFKLAGKLPREYYRIFDGNVPEFPLSQEVSWLTVPWWDMEAKTTLLSKVLLSTVEEVPRINLLGKTHGVVPVICVDYPLLHTYPDGTRGYVYGVCSVGNSCLITTQPFQLNLSPHQQLVRIAMTTFHELGHDLHLCPPSRPTSEVDMHGSHCRQTSCTMHKCGILPEQLAAWQRGQPLCKECLNDLVGTHHLP